MLLKSMTQNKEINFSCCKKNSYFTEISYLIHLWNTQDVKLNQTILPNQKAKKTDSFFVGQQVLHALL